MHRSRRSPSQTIFHRFGSERPTIGTSIFQIIIKLLTKNSGSLEGGGRNWSLPTTQVYQNLHQKQFNSMLYSLSLSAAAVAAAAAH